MHQLTLAAPRANALEPGLLDAMRRTLDTVEAKEPTALILRAGKNFCSGGDIVRFHEAVRGGRGRDYAETVVPALQDIVHRLVALPAPVALAGRGAITGGGAGFLFAADLAVLHPGAFVQPYYARVGFAPDGGWTALLPQRVAPAAALNWIMSDTRMDAAALQAMGLAAAVDDEPETAIHDLLTARNLGTLAAAKTLIWTQARLAELRRALAAEALAFRRRIEAPDTMAGMEQFLTGLRAAHV